MSKSKGWIGVDLDGTLAMHRDDWHHHLDIGDPVPRMVERVKGWLEDGEEVRIVTARADVYSYIDYDDDTKAYGIYEADDIRSRNAQHKLEETRVAIRAWCVHHLGKELPITAAKDVHMRELWDDRAVRVIQNTGERSDAALATVLCG